MALVIENAPANARDAGLIPALGSVNPWRKTLQPTPLHYSFLKNPQTEEHVGLQSIGFERLDMTEMT